LQPPDPALFATSVVVATLSALLVFWHADRHGSAHATAWGVAAFLFALVVVPLYFVRYRLRQR